MKTNKIVTTIIIFAILTVIGFGCYEEFISLSYLFQYKNIMTVINFEPLSNNSVNSTLNVNSSSYDKLTMCFVSDTGECQIKSTSLEKFTKAELIYVNGNINLLLPELRYARNIDDNYCIIDTTTASELYGHTDVIGMEVTVNNKTLVICNVINAQQQFIITSDTRNSDLLYNQLWVNTCGRSSKIILNKLLVIHNIQGNTICYDTINFLPLCLIAVLIIFILVFLTLILRKKKLQSSNTKNKLIFCGIQLFIILFGVIFVLIFVGKICPVDLLPTQWSKFDEWQEIILSVKDSLEMLLVKKMLFVEYNYILELLKSIFLAFITFIVLWMFKGYIYNKMIYIFNMKTSKQNS